MKPPRLGFAAFGLIAALVCMPVKAAPLFFNFDINFTTGPLSPQTFHGLFSVDSTDCSTSFICSGVFQPNSVSHTLLSFSVTIAGIAFSASSDTGFPNFPQITFNNLGAVTNINYDGLVGSGTNAREIELNFGIATWFNPFNTAFVVSQGNVVPRGQVPEPGTISLLAGALMVAFLLARRRKPRTISSSS